MGRDSKVSTEIPNYDNPLDYIYMEISVIHEGKQYNEGAYLNIKHKSIQPQMLELAKYLTRRLAITITEPKKHPEEC